MNIVKAIKVIKSFEATKPHSTISPRKPLFPSRSHSAAFTIVELLIVIIVIAILATISTIILSGAQQRATDSAVASKESQVKKKLEAYKIDNDSYPPDQAVFDSVVGQTPGDKLYTTYTPPSQPGLSDYSLQTDRGGGANIALLPPTDCPSGFIPVPGNASLGTDGFCVMKYEAKNAGSNVPVSQANGSPWVNITQANAIAYSQNVAGCTGCHLITEAEWMTIAANVLSVSSNWSGGAVGSGYIYNGHVNERPSSFLAATTDDMDGMYGITGGTGDGPQYNNRRTLSLTNNEVIWDMAGNAQEWTTGVITGSQPGASGFSSREYLDITNWGNLPELSRPSFLANIPEIADIVTWDSTKGLGTITSSTTASATQGYIRGGHRCGNHGGGVLGLDLRPSPSCLFQNTIGFRVAR